MRLGRHDSQKAGQDQGGCASCALGGPGDDALAALAFAGVIIVGFFSRRRRR